MKFSMKMYEFPHENQHKNLHKDMNKEGCHLSVKVSCLCMGSLRMKKTFDPECPFDETLFPFRCFFLINTIPNSHSPHFGNVRSYRKDVDHGMVSILTECVIDAIIHNINTYPRVFICTYFHI